MCKETLPPDIIGATWEMPTERTLYPASGAQKRLPRKGDVWVKGEGHPRYRNKPGQRQGDMRKQCLGNYKWFSLAVGWAELRYRAPRTHWGWVPRIITKVDHLLVRSGQVAWGEKYVHGMLALPLAWERGERWGWVWPCGVWDAYEAFRWRLQFDLCLTK